MLTAKAAWSKWCLGCDNIYLQMTSIVSCRSDIDSLLFLVSDDEITERSTSDHTVRSTWPAALCVNLLVLWLEDRLTRLLSRTKIDFPALNSTGYLTPFWWDSMGRVTYTAFGLIWELRQCTVGVSTAGPCTSFKCKINLLVLVLWNVWELKLFCVFVFVLLDRTERPLVATEALLKIATWSYFLPFLAQRH